MKYLILSVALLLTIASCEKEERDPDQEYRLPIIEVLDSIPINYIEPDTAYTKDQ